MKILFNLTYTIKSNLSNLSIRIIGPREDFNLSGIDSNRNRSKTFLTFTTVFFCLFHKISSKNMLIGLPWWHSGWESACQCRGHGFEPWSGKIPHAAEQLGPWATITKPARLEPVLLNKRGHDSERPTHRDEEWLPLAATRESPRTETKTQHSHK